MQDRYLRIYEFGSSIDKPIMQFKKYIDSFLVLIIVIVIMKHLFCLPSGKFFIKNSFFRGAGRPNPVNLVFNPAEQCILLTYVSILTNIILIETWLIFM